MTNITIEQAIALRDTIAPPTLNINSILYNEKMDMYQDIACGRILDRLDDHKEYQDDIIFDIMDNFYIKVTLFGFWLIKDIMLNYISEESYNKYLELIRLYNEQINSSNIIIKTLRGMSKKALKDMLLGLSQKSLEDSGNIATYIKAELKARRHRNVLYQKIKLYKTMFKVSLRAEKISTLIKIASE